MEISFPDCDWLDEDLLKLQGREIIEDYASRYTIPSVEKLSSDSLLDEIFRKLGMPRIPLLPKHASFAIDGVVSVYQKPMLVPSLGPRASTLSLSPPQLSDLWDQMRDTSGEPFILSWFAKRFLSSLPEASLHPSVINSLSQGQRTFIDAEKQCSDLIRREHRRGQVHMLFGPLYLAQEVQHVRSKTDMHFNLMKILASRHGQKVFQRQAWRRHYEMHHSSPPAYANEWPEAEREVFNLVEQCRLELYILDRYLLKEEILKRIRSEDDRTLDRLRSVPRSMISSSSSRTLANEVNSGRQGTRRRRRRAGIERTSLLWESTGESFDPLGDPETDVEAHGSHEEAENA